jgi:hypothetical protein
MGRTRTALAVAGCGIALSGCMSMTPANYMVSPEARVALGKYAGSKVAIADMAAPAAFDPMCRAVGNIKIVDGMNLGQFVAKGFNDELKYAGLYADNGARLTGAVTKVEFSTSAQVVNGWWDLGISLKSSNGQSMTIENRYDFEAGFSGASACNNASRELGTAVQKLVYKTITDPQFAALVK